MEKPSRDALIGENLAKLRGERSQAALAEAMRERGFKWAQATVWNVEKGERPLRLAEADALAEILGLEVVDLLKVPQWYLFFDALVALESAESALFEAADQVDYYRWVLAKAADELADRLDGADATQQVREELGDRRFDESPLDLFERLWVKAPRAHRGVKPVGPFTREYASGSFEPTPKNARITFKQDDGSAVTLPQDLVEKLWVQRLIDEKGEDADPDGSLRDRYWGKGWRERGQAADSAE